MAKYDCSITLKVDGKPDTNVTCCCPDEQCFIDCQQAFLAQGAAMLQYRAANLTDAGVQHPAKGKKVKVSAKVLRDGHDHIDFPGYVLHDLSDAAVQAMEDGLQSFMGCSAAKKASAKRA